MNDPKELGTCRDFNSPHEYSAMTCIDWQPCERAAAPAETPTQNGTPIPSKGESKASFLDRWLENEKGWTNRAMNEFNRYQDTEGAALPPAEGTQRERELAFYLRHAWTFVPPGSQLSNEIRRLLEGK